MNEIRVVRDETATVGGTRCLLPVAGSLCWEILGHDTPCAPLPARTDEQRRVAS